MKVLFVLALAAALLLSTIALSDDVFAFNRGDGSDHQVGDQMEVKSRGFAECQTSSGGDCGDYRLKTKLLLLMVQADEDSGSGIGKVQGTFSLIQEGFPRQSFSSNDLTFVYSKSANTVDVSGDITNKNGLVIGQMDMTISEIDGSKKKGICSSEIANTIGDKIQQLQVNCRLIIVPIES